MCRIAMFLVFLLGFAAEVQGQTNWWIESQNQVDKQGEYSTQVNMYITERSAESMACSPGTW